MAGYLVINGTISVFLVCYKTAVGLRAEVPKVDKLILLNFFATHIDFYRGYLRTLTNTCIHFQ